MTNIPEELPENSPAAEPETLEPSPVWEPRRKLGIQRKFSSILEEVAEVLTKTIDRMRDQQARLRR